MSAPLPSRETDPRPRRQYVPLVLFVIASALIFPNLGNRHLWQDEAETALVAKNILRTGLPLGWDGRLFVTQLSGAEMTASYVWAWTPWLMHYVAALGMAVAGATAFGARWPFALAGCLSFPLFYTVVVRVARDRSLALVASVLLLASVQYLLLMRQCRYYALLPVFFLLGLSGYDALPLRRGVVLLSLGLVGLFHSNSVSCAIAASGFALHALLFRRDAAVAKRLAFSFAVLLAGSVPWILATGLLDRTAGRVAFARGFVGACLMSNRYLCPWLVLAGLGIAVATKKIRFQRIDTVCLCMFVPMLFFLPAYLWPNPRYVAFLLPAGALLAARAIVELHTVRSWLAYALGGVCVFTNLLVVPLPALLPRGIGRDAFSGELESGSDALKLGVFRSEIGGYIFELTHASGGPDEALASFIEANTAPDDLIFMTNDCLSSMFHTGRRFAGVAAPSIRNVPRFAQLPSYVWDATQARWFILRGSRAPGPIDAYRARVLQSLGRAGITVEKSFLIDVDDVRWINRELVSKHVFRPRNDRSGSIEVLRLSKPDRPVAGDSSRRPG